MRGLAVLRDHIQEMVWNPRRISASVKEDFDRSACLYGVNDGNDWDVDEDVTINA
jgi:hypothetical protein